MFALVFCPSSRLTSPSTTNSFFLILVFSFIWLTQSETMQCVFCQPAWFTSCSERHRGSDVAWLTLVMMSNWNVLLAENPRWSRVSPQKQPAGVSVCLCNVCFQFSVFSCLFVCFSSRKCFTHRLVSRATVLHVVQLGDSWDRDEMCIFLLSLMALSSALCVDAQKKRIVFQVTLSNHSLNAWKLPPSCAGRDQGQHGLSLDKAFQPYFISHVVFTRQ